jgi:hypothetical protein
MTTEIIELSLMLMGGVKTSNSETKIELCMILDLCSLDLEEATVYNDRIRKCSATARQGGCRPGIAATPVQDAKEGITIHRALAKAAVAMTWEGESSFGHKTPTSSDCESHFVVAYAACRQDYYETRAEKVHLNLPYHGYLSVTFWVKTIFD